MQLLDYLQQMIQWKVQSQKKFIYIYQDGILKLLLLKGNPSSITDEQIDFEVLQMPIEKMKDIKLNTYYYQNGQYIGTRGD